MAESIPEQHAPERGRGVHRRPSSPLRGLWVTCAVVLVVSVVAVAVLMWQRQDEAPKKELSLDGPAHAAPVFGTQFHGTWSDLTDGERERILDTLVDNGVTWVRIDISWSMIAPRKGQYDMKWGVPLVDKVLKMARDRGLKVLGMFWLTPAWAGKHGKRAMPSDVRDYASAIGWAAQRWHDEVEAWQVWNEPNSREFLQPPSPSGYVRLLKAAYPAVKAGDPGAKVVFGGTQYVDTDWIRAAYDSGAIGSYDVMAVHPYQGDAALPPESPSLGRRERLTNTAELVRLMHSRGEEDKPVWFTEFGWSSHSNPSGTKSWQRGVSEQTQASYLSRALNLVRTKYPEVTMVFWYTSRDLRTGNTHQDNRGLIRRDFTAKPALRAARCYIRGCGHDDGPVSKGMP